MSEKQLEVVPTGTGLYVIKMSGGGPTPNALQGKYTSYREGKEAIQVYQAKVQASPDIKYPKKKDNAGTET